MYTFKEIGGVKMLRELVGLLLILIPVGYYSYRYLEGDYI
jgi:hypothetical protein